MSASAADLSGIQKGVVLTFGAVCLAMGLRLFVSIIKDNIYGSWRTRAGVTTTARLLSVDWHKSTVGARGGGMGSTVVSYDYRVGGQSFTGLRITLFKQSGDFYRPLSAAWRAGRPVRIFVDPEDPRFAVIDREFAWWPIVVAVPFSLTFVAIGLLIGWLIFPRSKNLSRRTKTMHETKVEHLPE